MYLPCGAGESFAETDKRYLAAEAGANRDDGCTAVTAVLTESSVVVAHVGDSRVVLARGGKGERKAGVILPAIAACVTTCLDPLCMP